MTRMFNWGVPTECEIMLCEIADTLPISHAKATQLKVHISYFLQKCKKGKPWKWDLPFWYLKTQGFWNYADLCSIAVRWNQIFFYSLIGDSSGSKTFKILTITINDHKVGSFSNKYGSSWHKTDL